MIPTYYIMSSDVWKDKLRKAPKLIIDTSYNMLYIFLEHIIYTHKEMITLLRRTTSLILALVLLFTTLPSTTTNASTALPRIQTCSGDPAYFCYETSGSAFYPAGMNYTQTKTIEWQLAASTATYESHETLLVNGYHATNVQNALNQIASDGYNVVRVMINPEGKGYTRDAAGQITGTYYGVGGPWTMGSSHTNGLYVPYMDNVLDFLNRAKNLNLHVILTLNYIPDNAYYALDEPDKPLDASGNYYVNDVNLYYMSQAWIDKKKSYVSNFLNYIKTTDNSLLSTVFAIDLQNEVNLVTNAAPFTRTDTVPTADGGTYNMSIDSQRQQAIDANIVNWANQLVASGKLVDSKMLFTASVFTFHAIGLSSPNGVHSGTDPRYPARPDVLSNWSDLDYIDMHVYRDTASYDLDADLDSSYFASINKSTKPLFLGEFGAFKDLYTGITDAAYALKDHKNALVLKGFKGWALWSWDSNQSHMYNALDSSGAINGQLAPSVNGF